MMHYGGDSIGGMIDQPPWEAIHLGACRPLRKQEAHAIKEAIVKSGRTQISTAREFGVEERQFYRMLACRGEWTPGIIHQIKRALGVDY